MIEDKKKTDPYKILGLTPKDSMKKIKHTFRKLCKECHPDVLPKGKPGLFYVEMKERYDEINKAYQILTSPEAMRQYKKYGYVMYEELETQMAQACNLLIKMISQAIETYQGDFIDKIKTDIEINTGKISDRIEGQREKILKYKGLRKKVKKKKGAKEDHTHLFFGILDEKINDCNKQIMFYENEIELGKLMARIVDTVDFKDGTMMINGMVMVMDGINMKTTGTSGFNPEGW